MGSDYGIWIAHVETDAGPWPIEVLKARYHKRAHVFLEPMEGRGGWSLCGRARRGTRLRRPPIGEGVELCGLCTRTDKYSTMRLLFVPEDEFPHGIARRNELPALDKCASCGPFFPTLTSEPVECPRCGYAITVTPRGGAHA